MRHTDHFSARWVKNVIYALFALSLFVTYTLVREPFQINEVIRIPLIDYILIFATYGLWLMVAVISKRIRDWGSRSSSGQLAAGD